MKTESATSPSDDQLWQRSRLGDRDAFAGIVERYQALVCSLTYSASGSLARSEDLAQETFITAWQQLGDLRDPSRLKVWLCGIARNLAANAHRKERRRGGPAQSLDTVPDDVVAEVAVSHDDPLTHVVSQEEETLLWNSLARLPETYREPMVLFYRQGESIAAVAGALDLTEDAVKQRLSRGRALLRKELTGVVESILTRSRPGLAFTLGVLTALPAVTAPPHATAAIVAAAAGPGAGAAKGLFAGIGKAAFIGPAIGLLVGFLGTRAAASTARSPEERKVILGHARRMVVFCWVMSIALAAVLSQAGKLYTATPLAIIVGVFAWTGVLVGTILWASRRIEREVGRIRVATGTDDATYGAALAERGLRLGGPLLYRSSLRVFGLPLVDVACGGTDAGSFRTRRAVGWIALGDVAVSPLLALGGFAIAPVAFGAVTLGILSFSLWGAAGGLLAFGSIAIGWWAFGFGALGWEAAGGAVAVARDYAMGAIVRAAETNTPAAEACFTGQWFATPLMWFVYSAHRIILAIVVFAIGRLAYRGWQRRRSR